jgi:hypothetical protein
MYIGTQPYSGIRARHTYTATAGQTSFSGAGAENVTLTYADELYIDVYQNGVKLSPADYTATSGTTVVLGTGATVSDIIEVVKYDAFSVADTVSAKDGGGFGGNISTSGTLAVTGTSTFTGAITSNAGVVVDNITIDGTEIDLSSGDLTLDVAGDLIIDTDGAEVKLKDGGTLYGKLHNHNPGNAATSLIVESSVQDQDILLKGNDGGSVITALALDMSAAGEAKFNDNIVMGTAGKGIHLGVTSATASNLLDDYEEGTWTPAFASTNATFSYAQQHGTYTKVGRLIMLSFRLALNQAPGGTTSNGAVVSGLPFNSASLAGSYHGGMFGHYFGINLDSTGVMAYQTHSGGATVELKVVGDNLGEQGVQAQDLLSNAEIRGQIIYHTA